MCLTAWLIDRLLALRYNNGNPLIRLYGPASTHMRGGTIQEQTDQVFANLRAILEEAGSGLDRIVKATVFLQSLDDFPGMNEVYATHVGEHPPARSTVEVAKLPSGALVEIEAVALL